jgi:hypothetical protein
MRKISGSRVRVAVLGTALVAVVLTTVGAALGAANPGRTAKSGPASGVAAQLALTKAVLAKYKSVEVAKRDGYLEGSPCLAIPAIPDQTSYGGGMGFHYVNEALLKTGKVIATKPPVLLYAPVAGGGLELVAAEWFRADADQNPTTDDDRPTLFGRAFDGPMVGHGPGMPMHFDLHVWLWKRNPSGIFSSWNPTVTCPPPTAAGATAHAH